MEQIKIGLDALKKYSWNGARQEDFALPDRVRVLLSTGNQFKQRVAESSLEHGVDIIDFRIDEEELRTAIPDEVPTYLYPVVLSILKGKKTIELMGVNDDQIVVSADTVVMVGDRMFNRAKSKEELRLWSEALKVEREIDYWAGVSAIGPKIGIAISYLNAPIKDFSNYDWGVFLRNMGEDIWKMGINIMTPEFRELLDDSKNISWGYGIYREGEVLKYEVGRKSVRELRGEQFESLTDFSGEIRPFMSGLERHLLANVIAIAGDF